MKTDLNVTRSYCRFLFNRELIVEDWVEEVNRFDLYLFLETDCPFVQDGTRLTEQQRNLLGLSHKEQLQKSGINYTRITGNREQRFTLAVAAVQNLYNTA